MVRTARRDPMRRLLVTAAAALIAAASCSRSPQPQLDPLPGAQRFDAALERDIAGALARRDRNMPARTRHVRPDGTPRYTNRLILESSPYLLQHAHNPVDWRPWN